MTDRYGLERERERQRERERERETEMLLFIYLLAVVFIYLSTHLLISRFKPYSIVFGTSLAYRFVYSYLLFWFQHGLRASFRQERLLRRTQAAGLRAEKLRVSGFRGPKPQHPKTLQP